MAYFFHFSISISSFYAGEYILTCLQQLFFIATFLKKNIFVYLFYIPIIIFTLSKLFAFSFILYFVELILFLYYIYSQRLILDPKVLFVFFSYFLGLFMMYKFFEDEIYDFLFTCQFYDTINYISIQTFLFLNLLHLFILLLLGYNKEKLFRI